MKKLFTLFLFVFFVTSVSNSQNLENRINKFALDFGSGYTRPLVEALGMMMNNGWMSVKAMKDKFSIDVGVTGLIVLIPSSDKEFTITSPFPTYQQDVAPTVVGPSEERTISGSANKYPKGFNLGVLPVIMPQLSVGNLYGTRLILRAMPKIQISDIGYLSLFGVGAQHSITQHFKKVTPVDVAVAFAYETINLGDIASANSFTGSVMVSKKVSVISFYALTGFDYSKMTFDYSSTYTDPTPPNNTVTARLHYETNGKNGLKFAIGGSGESRFVRFNAGMTLLPKFCINLGLGLGAGIK